MDLHFLGGAMEIGGSCIYIRIMGRGVLLDCGIRQGGAKDPLPDFRTIQEQGGLDAIIISHAHMDHIGTLPIISRAYPLARIYMTAMTADLTRVLLYDSLKIMEHREDEIPHYSEPDVRAMLERIVPVGLQTPYPVFEQFQLTFYPAGHIAGAACVYLVTDEGSLFYSGDFSAFSQRTIEGMRIPRLRPDVVMVETTYGNSLHGNRQVEERRLVALVNECIQEKKKVLIPAFALGRAQEVLLILRAAIQNQEIPPVPVYVDGMVREVNLMYERNPTYLKNALAKRILKGNEPFYTKEIQPVAAMQNREELLDGDGPAIFISSSGMLTGGPSALYAARLAPLEQACIIITGYQDEESPGRQLLNLLESGTEKTLTLNGCTIPVKCRVEQVGLSAHADQSEIMALLGRLSARRIFLVHGNPEVMEELGNELAAADYRRQVYLPECGQHYEISLRSKRKQLLFQPSDTMRMERPFTHDDEQLLWSYWQGHYPGKAFTIPQIAYIWSGKIPDANEGCQETDTDRLINGSPLDKKQACMETNDSGAGPSDEKILQRMQRIFLDSCYFRPNAKRLFLYEANSSEEVAHALEPKELTQQELTQRIEASFAEYPYRKISYHVQRKEITLQFDYPDRQAGPEFERLAEQFQQRNGWSVQASTSMNHCAAELFLETLFGNRIVKMSYYLDKKCYMVQLAGTPQETDEQAARKFLEKTGWTLVINGKLQGSTCPDTIPDGGQGADFFMPHSTERAVEEQNKAFLRIDQMFAQEAHQPEKKSLKQDAAGKYLEVGFVSPMVGRQYHKLLQEAANQTGWRIHIAERINQNGLIKTAQLLCTKYEIPLKKMPSYLPGQRAVQLKAQAMADEGKCKKAAEEFKEMTGCDCIILHSEKA